MEKLKNLKAQTWYDVYSIAVIIFLLVIICVLMNGCREIAVPQKTTPHTIDSTNKAVITFETEIKPLAVTGVYFISAPGIPAAPEGGTYSPVEIPSNRGITIRARVVFDNNIIRTKDCIDTEVDLALPPLAAGSYSMAFASDWKDRFTYIVMPIIGPKIVNKRVELKDSSGNVLFEHKF
ncbi:MAG: hypothetical protein FWB86_14385 [Treponema sp.]|nr:hypothetical protein [Treponema sp.]